MKKCKALNLNRLEKRLEGCHTASAIKTAMMPLTKRKCPHYGVVKDHNGFHLIYAGLSDYMNLELLLEITEMLQGYIHKTISMDDCNLTDYQILLLVLYGYGVVVYINTIDGTIEVCALQKELDSSHANIQKNTLFESTFSMKSEVKEVCKQNI